MTFTRTFPDGFVFGTATASYQIEGAVAEGGRSPSIWDTFSHTPGKVAGGDTGDVAGDHYHRWEGDLDIMSELGVDAYRFSVAWPRVIPAGTGAVNGEGLDFYSRLVDGLLARGITPFVTLYHWDLPQVLQDRGGWQNRDVADWFAEYGGAVVGALGDRVRNWTTLNEPWVSAFLGHSIGVHAPGHTDPLEGIVAAHHLMLAHGRAVPVIRENSAASQVSITLNPTQIYGPDRATAADEDAVRRADNIYNGVFYRPLFSGRYPDGFLEDTAHLTDHGYIHDSDLTEISAPIDNLGINNYFPTRVRAAGPGEEGTPALAGMERVTEVAPLPPHTAMGWEISPRGHYDILMRSAKESLLPVYITENGSAWPDEVSADGRVHDPDRIEYLHGHLGAVADAIEDGADIRGYFAWSLLDNFEWASGYGKRFGIVHVDYDSQQRIVKDSGREYARIIRAARDATGS